MNIENKDLLETLLSYSQARLDVAIKKGDNKGIQHFQEEVKKIELELEKLDKDTKEGR